MIYCVSGHKIRNIANRSQIRVNVPFVDVLFAREFAYNSLLELLI